MKGLVPFLKPVLVIMMMVFQSGYSDTDMASTGMMVLKNGDQIPSGIDAVVSDGFRVQFPWVKDPFVIRFQDVKWYVQPEVTPSPFTEGVVLTLNTGEQISGSGLNRTTGGDWQFKTHWGQLLSVSPEQVERIRMYPEGRLKLSGPSSGDEWGSRSSRRMPGSNERGRRPVLGGRAVLHARQPTMFLPSSSLPDPFLIEIEYSFAGDPSNTRFSLFQNSGRLRSGHLNLALSRDRLSANWTEFEKKNPNRRRGKNWSEKVETPAGIQRLRVMGSSETGKIFLTLNDSFKKEFSFPALNQDHFFDQFKMMISQHHADPLIVSGVRVIEWDVQKELPASAPVKGKSRLITYEGRIETGEVVALTESELEWRNGTGGDSIFIPRAMIFELSYHPERKPGVGTGQSPNRHILYTGVSGDHFSVEVLGLEDQILIGKSSFSPDTLRIPLASIQFWKMEQDAAVEESL